MRRVGRRSLFRARKGIAASARTPVLPEAIPVGALSAQTRNSNFGRAIPEFWGEVQPPSVTEGARYSFSPSRLCPLETEQKAGVRNGKPDFSLRNQCCRRGCTSRRNPPGGVFG